MSTEFQTLDKAKHGEKISFVGIIVKIGDLKSGTGDQGDYTYKRLTIQDVTASLELTVWNEDIKKFVLGGKYEIINAYAKEYKGTLGLGIQYAEVKLVGTNKQQATMDESTKESATRERFQESPTTQKSNLPQMAPHLQELVETETVTLLQIKQDVYAVLSHYGGYDMTDVDSKITAGMFIKEIYRESKKVKFEKSSG